MKVYKLPQRLGEEQALAFAIIPSPMYNLFCTVTVGCIVQLRAGEGVTLCAT